MNVGMNCQTQMYVRLEEKKAGEGGPGGGYPLGYPPGCPPGYPRGYPLGVGCVIGGGRAGSRCAGWAGRRGRS